MIKCERCGNSDLNYFYKGYKGLYCRKCVSFKRILLEDKMSSFEYEVNDDSSSFSFDYSLTPLQDEISNKCLDLVKDNKDVLLKAVCGAGKTEIVVKSISYFLKRKKKVCYAISRKEVVVDLYKRFKGIFKDANVVALYGGHHEELTGDLIICTTHQLFRFYKTFDLLILDEVDAFPLAGNSALVNISLNSSTGPIIFSTATVNNFLNNILKNRNYEKLELYVRPTYKPLIVPELIISFKLYLYLYLYYLLKRMNTQCIIFVSNKKLCRNLYCVYKLFFKCTYVYSDLKERDKNIKDFRDKKYQFIFSTTVLERGVTIKDVNVIILCIDQNVFNEGSLVQMLGRVGRNFNNPYGESYILSSRKNDEIDKAINNLKEANKKYELSILRQKNK